VLGERESAAGCRGEGEGGPPPPVGEMKRREAPPLVGEMKRRGRGKEPRAPPPVGEWEEEDEEGGAGEATRGKETER